MILDRRFLDVRLRVEGTVNNSTDTVNGRQFIVGAAPTGNFATASANDIASYDGYKNKWNFYKPHVDNIEIFNIEVGKWQFWNGTAWTNIPMSFSSEFYAEPVISLIATGTTNPVAAAVGDKFLNTATGLVHTATEVNTWNAGAETNDNDRYASRTDAQIYTKKNGTFIGVLLVNGTTFIAKDTDKLYCYDAEGGALSVIGGEATVPDATYTEKGKVSVAENGGIKITSGSISLNHKTITVTHTLTQEEITAKSFNLAKKVVTGLEESVAVSIGGVAQIPVVDFNITQDSGVSKFSWVGLGLASIALIAGDIFVITYTTDAN